MTTPSSGVCIRCAARGTSCCVSREGVQGPPLTPADEARISARTGLSGDALVTVRAVDAVEQDAWRDEDPSLSGVARSGAVRSLLRGPDGFSCLFLEREGRGGCGLGEDRPLACQRFPFVQHGRTLLVRPGGECLAAEVADDLDGLLVLLGTSRDEQKRLDRQLRAEL
jgi:Fe-S-cluster containining protein